ncbi:MAG: hypothetical protein LBK76_03740 [Verrucomicrobiales bacterium]|jgi:hypothetical protein|nr:hypothetical protein [Verrucomicrobiales bacterium]
MPTACPFQFIEQGSHAAIVHEGREIVRLDQNIAYFGSAYWVRDQVMVPGGKPEIAVQPVCSAYPHCTLAAVRYEVTTQGDTLQIRIIPVKLRGSQSGLFQWKEENILSVRIEDGRYVWKQEAVLRFFHDFDLDARDNNGMRIYRFHHVDGRPGRLFQFFDPAPAGASGPAVPMIRDWIGFPEPYNGPDSFRQHWKREYVEIILQDPDGSFAKAPLNKTLWLYLTFDNRRSRPCAAKGPFYLVKDTGEALECQVDAPTHYHHVCEWGMDFHAWCDLDPFACGNIIPAGTQIICATTSRMVDRETVRAIADQARPLRLTPEEHACADMPAYEEPENTFTVSNLDRLDAQQWRPTSEGCSWLRTGGHSPGSGCLVIRNSYAATGSWFCEFGPQSWGNPFIPGARYRFSAWVRVEDFVGDGGYEHGPQLGVELTQGNGPSVASTRTLVDYGWSPSLFNDRLPIWKTMEWTKIELITDPVPNNILRGVLKLRFGGRGTAWFSSVRWEPVESS